MSFLNTATDTDTVRDLKKFGLIFGPFAIAISCWQAWRGHWIHVFIFAPLGCYALIMAVVRPAWVFPVRWVLETLFKSVMWVFTNLVLIICFYCVFTPIGLILRLMRKDLLNQTLDGNAQSYWQDPEREDFDPQHYLKQF